jgi:hypothetical protein
VAATSRHVCMVEAPRAWCVLAEVRWRWMLNGFCHVHPFVTFIRLSRSSVCHVHPFVTFIRLSRSSVLLVDSLARSKFAPLNFNALVALVAQPNRLQNRLFRANVTKPAQALKAPIFQHIALSSRVGEGRIVACHSSVRAEQEPIAITFGILNSSGVDDPDPAEAFKAAARTLRRCGSRLREDRKDPCPGLGFSPETRPRWRRGASGWLTANPRWFFGAVSEAIRPDWYLRSCPAQFRSNGGLPPAWTSRASRCI